MWQLIINGPGYFDTSYELPEGITQVGRADENDIVLSGDLVSRKHCRVHVREQSVTLEDLGSRNGTSLHGTLVVGSIELKPGDPVTIGQNVLTLRRLRNADSVDAELVDVGAGGQVKRFGRGVDLREALLLARDIKESSVLRALDNFAPFEQSEAPVRRSPADTADGDTEGTDVGFDEREVVPSLVLLYRVAEALARAPSLQAFLDETCDLLMQRVQATTAVVLLRHASGVMVPAAVRHGKRLARGEVPVSDGILEAALAKGQAIAVANVHDDTRFSHRDSVVLYGVYQVLCVPIGTKSPFGGVLYLNRSRAAAEPVEALLDVCTAIAQLLDTGVQKFRLAPSRAKIDRLQLGLERLYSPAVASRRAIDLHESGRLSQVSEMTGTVLYAQLVGLAEGASQLASERLAGTLAEWQRIVTRLIMSFDGAIDLVTGDSVRAVFGAPYPKSDDAIRAVRAGMALRDEWEEASRRRGGTERFKLRIGLATGPVFAGAVGTDARFDSVLLGESVVVAQRLAESASGDQVLLTGKTLARIGARFDVNPLGERKLEGTSRIAVFEALNEDSDASTLGGVA